MASAWGSAWGASWGNSWGTTRIEESARSGYWRLYFYQLQEKVLKLDLSEVKLGKKPIIDTPRVRFVKEPPRQPTKKKLFVSKPAATGQVPVPSQYTSPNTHDICDISLVYLVMQSIPRPTRPAEVKSTPNDNPKNQRQKIASMLLLLAA